MPPTSLLDEEASLSAKKIEMNTHLSDIMLNRVDKWKPILAQIKNHLSTHPDLKCKTDCNEINIYRPIYTNLKIQIYARHDNSYTASDPQKHRYCLTGSSWCTKNLKQNATSTRYHQQSGKT